jgi:predicted phosphoribosyltransferase
LNAARAALHDPVVIALPRGGVPVGAVIARAWRAPLDIVVVRKLGVPAQPELAMGAIGEDGVRVIEPNVRANLQVSERDLLDAEARERVHLSQRVQRLRNRRPRTPVYGREVVLVDDGVATGSSARAAMRVLRAGDVGRIVLAVPVAPARTVESLGDLADAVVCVATPEPFDAVGLWYRDFSATTDDEVVRILGELS